MLKDADSNPSVPLIFEQIKAKVDMLRDNLPSLDSRIAPRGAVRIFYRSSAQICNVLPDPRWCVGESQRELMPVHTGTGLFEPQPHTRIGGLS